MMELGLYENIKSAIRKIRNKNELSQQEELCAAAVTGKNCFENLIFSYFFYFVLLQYEIFE